MLKYAARRIADFGGDSTVIATVKLNRVDVSLEELFEALKLGGPVYAPLTPAMGEHHRAKLSVVRENQTGFIDNYRPEELEYLVRTIEGDGESALYAVPAEESPSAVDVISMLARMAIRQGYGLAIEGLQRVEFARYVGLDSPREGLLAGKLIGCSALKVELVHP